MVAASTNRRRSS